MKLPKSFLPCLAVFLLLAAGPASAQEQRISSFMLDNGLEVVVIPDRRAPVVTHMIWYKVGSADERAGESGIAHFLEHLMFKGTEEHPGNEFSRAIAAIGGTENAFTSYDYTAYFQQVSSDALEMVMTFEADRMRGLVLTDEVVGPEREVVIEERRSRVDNNPGAMLGEETNAVLFRNHPYGRPVIGWMHEIEQLDREGAIAFYDLHYAPNNAVLVVAGDVEEQRVRELAEATYGAVPRGPSIRERRRPVEPPNRTMRTVSLSDPRVTLPTLQKSWVVPSYASGARGPGEALDLLAEILGGGARSRLYQELVVRQGIAASVGAYYRGAALDDTVFAVYGAPRGEAVREDVEAAIDAEIERIRDEGVTQEELERARNRFLRASIFARDSQSGMARIYGSALTTGSTVEDIAAWPERIRAVTPEDVRAAAIRYIDLTRSVTGYLNPSEDARP